MAKPPVYSDRLFELIIDPWNSLDNTFKVLKKTCTALQTLQYMQITTVLAHAQLENLYKS
jgi:hypothetical protein